jgi:uncharacterized membrane protein (DUF373 family)
MRESVIASHPSYSSIPHTDVHRTMRRWFELAQDFIVASLAVIMLVVMVQGLWVLARLAIVLGGDASEVLSQIVLVLILVELFRTLVFYLHEHRVEVPLMLEVAFVSELREILLNQPTSLGPALYGNAILLVILGSMLLAFRFLRSDDPETRARIIDDCASRPAVPR